MKAVLLQWMNESPKFVLALGLTLMVGACASQSAEPEQAAAAAPAAAGTPAATALAGNEEQLICRREQVTGTNFRERVCLTAEGWKALQRSERRVAQEYSRQQNNAAGEAAARQGNMPAGTGL